MLVVWQLGETFLLLYKLYQIKIRSILNFIFVWYPPSNISLIPRIHSWLDFSICSLWKKIPFSLFAKFQDSLLSKYLMRTEKFELCTIILFVLILFAKTYLLFCFVIHQALTVLHSPNDIWPRNSPGSILASDWTILITWPQYWPLIGPGSIRNGVTLRDPGDPD